MKGLLSGLQYPVALPSHVTTTSTIKYAYDRIFIFRLELAQVQQPLPYRLLELSPVLPDGLDQLPPREVLFTAIVTLVSRVEVCNKA